jgi:hypothetical protein
MNMAPNSTSCCQCSVTRLRPNASSRACCGKVLCRARSTPINCVAIRRRRPRFPNWCAGGKRVFVKAAARSNSRAEISDQPTRDRERSMRGFRDPERAQALLSSFGPMRQHFALHSIANSSRQNTLPGANSPALPKIRGLLSKGLSYLS